MMLAINKSSQTFDRLILLEDSIIIGEIASTPIKNKFRLSAPNAIAGAIAMETIMITRYKGVILCCSIN